jgi:ribose-phosphate pyrophosphokinase
VVSGDLLIGPVQGAHVILVDDLISAGSTILRAVNACREAGAVRIEACATHGVFEPEAIRLLGPDGPDRLIVTDSILPTRIAAGEGQREPTVLAASALYAEAIRRTCEGGSVVALREMELKPGK